MIIDGKVIAAQIEQEIQAKISVLKRRKPCLAMVIAGTHAPSQIYVSRKAQACEKIGMLSIRKHLSSDITEEELMHEVALLNADPSIDGILVQLPLPLHINPKKVIACISPEKDVDGLHPVNAGKLLTGDETGFVPCTPLGIKELLERSSIDVTGKHVLVIGRSNLVGKPMAALLMQNSSGANATVTVAHSHTKNIKELCLMADIIIAAIGKPKFLTEDMVKQGAVVIDVGINKIENHIVGDVDFEHVKDKCSFITPVPGGVGPMTIAMLLSNTWKSFQNKQHP
jgi:methylenetetrahydrofolate dehydrogenase (NADP+) / methenyltetrahydrofolate cyclohydrolase